MFFNLISKLKDEKIPVSIREYLTLLKALDSGLGNYNIEDFYFLSKTTLIKDEKYLDKFDKVFGSVFKGIQGNVKSKNLFDSYDIPKDWLERISSQYLTKEEKEKIKSMGGLKEVIKNLKKILAEQKKKHKGGNKWVGSGGFSPYGSYGYNPEGIRIGQDRNINYRAIKIWDKRLYKNLDDSSQLGTRNIKIALKRLRNFANIGSKEVLDLSNTIRSTANNAGHLNLEMKRERKNNVKVLLLIDCGGSMDEWVKICTELFSAAKTEFKNFEFFYFHNFIYESVWKDNYRRFDEKESILNIINKYNKEWKLIFIGDASMSPYEIALTGGSVEHWNEEPGYIWIQRLLNHYKKAVWINPIKKDFWKHTQSINMTIEILNNRMFPMTIKGIDKAMRELI